jgi:hypothetical protein
VWDATCSDTLCKSYILILLTSRTGAAAAKAEKKKRDLYSQLPNQYTLRPFVVETLGSFGYDVLQLLRQVGRRLRAESGDARKATWLTQRISVAIQRGNAASVLASLPRPPQVSKIVIIPEIFKNTPNLLPCFQLEVESNWLYANCQYTFSEF